MPRRGQAAARPDGRQVARGAVFGPRRCTTQWWSEPRLCRSPSACLVPCKFDVYLEARVLQDATIPAVKRLIEKPLPGFGEPFRMLSYSKVGSATILSRTTGGIIRQILIFALPSPPDAVETGWELLASKLSHFMRFLGKPLKVNHCRLEIEFLNIREVFVFTQGSSLSRERNETGFHNIGAETPAVNARRGGDES